MAAADPGFTWQVSVVALAGRASRAYARDHALELGRAASFHDTDPHPSAIELLLAALAADLIDGWREASRRAGLPPHDAELRLSTRLDEPLRHLGAVGATGSPAIAAVSGTLYIGSGAEPTTVECAWRETLERSPLHATLLRATPITITLSPVP